jgi:cysteinyl-tRNA synthetase
MTLKLYNSLTRQRETFTPIAPPRVGVYVCGPTVYGHSHLGHAKSYVSFDVIVRWLRFRGFLVHYVQNITDVGHLTDDADAGEDKVVAEARRRGLHPMAVVETFLKSYLDDMDALHVARPDIMPRATGHIPEQIEQIAQLIARGHAYEAGGSVYFDVASFKGYGKLSGRTVDELEAGARVAVNAEKRHPADFALWKRADASHLMQWDSPWGRGYPGWHIECSAMSRKYLGETFDIHGGGMENKFPHHECEIAQAECATGTPFARYWLHNNMCTINGQKMGKSLGNAVSLKDVFYTQRELRDKSGGLLLSRAFSPVVVRHFILTSHYRQPLDFSNDSLLAAESGSFKLRDALRESEAAAGLSDPNPDRPCGTGAMPTSASACSAVIAPDASGGMLAALSKHAASTSDQARPILEDTLNRFSEAMDEDFNTAAAIAVLFEFTKHTNQWLRGGASQTDLAAAAALLRTLACDVLGFAWPQEAAGGAAAQKLDEVMQVLIALRAEARKEKNFALTDAIRKRLGEIGIELRDGPSGTQWR